MDRTSKSGPLSGRNEAHIQKCAAGDLQQLSARLSLAPPDPQNVRLSLDPRPGQIQPHHHREKAVQKHRPKHPGIRRHRFPGMARPQRPQRYPPPPPLRSRHGHPPKRKAPVGSSVFGIYESRAIPGMDEKDRQVGYGAQERGQEASCMSFVLCAWGEKQLRLKVFSDALIHL